jgi:hypothetical protein
MNVPNTFGLLILPAGQACVLDFSLQVWLLSLHQGKDPLKNSSSKTPFNINYLSSVTIRKLISLQGLHLHINRLHAYAKKIFGRYPVDDNLVSNSFSATTLSGYTANN